MTVARDAPPIVPGRDSPAPGLVARIRGRASWRGWACAAGLGVLVSLVVALQTVHINFFWLHGRILVSIPWYVAFATVFYVAVLVAQDGAERGVPVPVLRFVFAATAASVACLALAAAFGDLYRLPPRREIAGTWAYAAKTYHPRDRRSSAVFGLGLDGVLHGWLATLIYAHLRNARLAARSLAEAQVERSEAGRQLLALRLQAARARVDPKDVHRALEEIERAYEHDPSTAESLVERLAAHLRDAIPRARADAGLQEEAR